VAQVSVTYDPPGADLASVVVAQLRSLGHEVAAARCERFPTADPMVAFLASLPTGLLIVSPSRAASEWLLREVATNRSHYRHIGLVVNSKTARSQPPLDPSVALSEDSLSPQALGALIAGLASGAA